MKNTLKALATLALLEASHPGYARLYQEKGHCWRSRGDPAAAISAYALPFNEHRRANGHVAAMCLYSMA